MENQNNPLKSFFRKPGIWVKLPSQGEYYTTKPADLNDMGEIPVYPMTAKDELMLKNADALLNGTAIVSLVKSCAPSIVDPENMPAVDLDTLLVAVKHCTYGSKMTVQTKHNCENAKEHEVSIDLNMLISDIKLLEKIEPVEHESGIKIFIKPVTVKDILRLNWVQYEQIRQLQMAEAQNVDEKTKLDLLQKSYEALTNESIKVISKCIDSVLLPDGVAVTDSKMIAEWVSDLSKLEYSKLEQRIMDTNSKGVVKEFDVHCPECNTAYKTTLDLNPTTFFA
jgi:hypothetical protein